MAAPPGATAHHAPPRPLAPAPPHLWASVRPLSSPAICPPVLDRPLTALHHAQVVLADLLFTAQLFAAAVADALAIFDDVGVVGNRQGHHRFLLDKEHAGTPAGDLRDRALVDRAHQAGVAELESDLVLGLPEGAIERGEVCTVVEDERELVGLLLVLLEAERHDGGCVHRRDALADDAGAGPTYALDLPDVISWAREQVEPG